MCVCVTDQRLLGDRAATYGPQDQRWNKSEMLAAKMDKFLAVRLAI